MMIVCIEGIPEMDTSLKVKILNQLTADSDVFVRARSELCLSHLS